MKDFLKTLGIVLLIGLVGTIISYFAIPEFKSNVNEHIFQIEQTVEDETPKDGENEEETDGETNEDKPTVEESNPPSGVLDSPLDSEGTTEE